MSVKKIFYKYFVKTNITHELEMGFTINENYINFLLHNITHFRYISADIGIPKNILFEMITTNDFNDGYRYIYKRFDQIHQIVPIKQFDNVKISRFLEIQ